MPQYKDYQDFILAIRRESDGYVVAAQGPGGVYLTHPFGYPSLEKLQGILANIEVHEYPSAAEIKEIGAELFRALLPSPILRTLDRAKDRLPEGTGLRLKLAGQPLELARLPWELLYDPEERGFLLRRLSSPIVRFIESGQLPPPLAAEPPLRVLHVQASPFGMEQLALGSSAQAIREALEDARGFTELPSATPAALRRALRQGQGYDILHYDEHATLEQGTGSLFLHDEEGYPAPLTGETLADWMDGSSVRLIVLSACKSGMASESQPFAGVAYQLMEHHRALPAVVAMQFAIADTAAIAFNRGFYEALADGAPVDAAIVEGRQRILDEDERSVAWAAPVLFMRTTSGEVLAPRPPGVPTRKERVDLETRYREAGVQRWEYVEDVDRDAGLVPLTNVFVMLQALDATRRTPSTPRPDLSPTPERLAEAGLDFPNERQPEQEAPPPPKPIPLSEALQQEQHLLLLGEPGAGKSTTLRFIALCFARPSAARESLGLDEPRIPLLVNLRELATLEPGSRLEEALVPQVMRLGPTEVQARPLLDRWLREERLALLLDGLDEVPGEAREALRQEIRRFATSPEGKACRIIVSSRLAGYQDLPRFKEYLLKPFAGAGDAQPYVAGWLAALHRWEPEKAHREARNLLDEMGKRPALKRLLNNPLLLRLAVSLYARSGEVAQNRTELYRGYLHDSAWPRAKARTQAPPDKEQVWQALEHIAWAMQTLGPQSETQLEATLRAALPEVRDARALLAFLREQLGLLARYPFKAEWYLAFSHLTFQEYFVAERLARWWHEIPDNTWTYLYPRLHHPAWHEPLLLLATALPTKQATALVRRTLHACGSYDSFLYRNLRLALEMMEAGGRIESGLQKEVEKQLKTFLNRGWFYNKWEMIPEILGEIGAPLTIPFLVQKLADEDVQIRLEAAVALGQIGNAQAIPALLKAFTDESVEVRRRAMLALGQIGDVQALPALLQVLSNTGARGRMMRLSRLSLRVVPLGTTQERLQEVQTMEEEAEVHKAAAYALGLIGNAQAVPTLIQVLSDHEYHYTVHPAAAYALGRIGNAQAVPALIEALSSDVTRKEATTALRQIGDVQSLQALAEKELGERGAAIVALGHR